jgi:hypothetical protein
MFCDTKLLFQVPHVLVGFREKEVLEVDVLHV